ncbi:MAG: DUF2800 domain-containing protein [Parcubacteria group bacterium]
MRLSNRSDSGLPILAKCLGPAVFRTVEHLSAPADSGSAIHKHMEHRALHGYEKAMQMLEQTVSDYDLNEVERDIAMARCRHFNFQPPEGSIAEIALAWNTSIDDEPDVVCVSGGQGRYETRWRVGAPGTIDLLFAEPEPIFWRGDRPRCPSNSTLWVCDYKTGSETWVDPVERNWQLKSAAVKAAQWTGAETVVPAIIYVGRGEGIWDVVETPWDEERLREVREQVFELHAKICSATPETVKLVEGYHCQWCPAITSCPVKIHSVQTLLGMSMDEIEPGISTEMAIQMANTLPIIRSMVGKSESALKAWVREHGPIPVGNGRYWGPRQKRTETMLPSVAIPILQKALGSYMNAAITISKSGLNKAIDAYQEASGLRKGARAAAMRDILVRVGKEGGLVSKPREEWCFYREGDVEDE